MKLIEKVKNFFYRKEARKFLTSLGIDGEAAEAFLDSTTQSRHKKRAAKAVLTAINAVRVYLGLEKYDQIQMREKGWNTQSFEAWVEGGKGGVSEPETLADLFEGENSERDLVSERISHSQVALAWAILEADEVGIGGPALEPGAATARVPALRGLGKGRKQARDGGAWSAAIERAENELRQILGLYPGFYPSEEELILFTEEGRFAIPEEIIPRSWQISICEDALAGISQKSAAQEAARWAELYNRLVEKNEGLGKGKGIERETPSLPEEASQEEEVLESAEKERLERTVVVTRHSALVEYLVDQGLIDESVEVKAHVEEEDVKGKHVIGVLPNHLASKARSLTEVPLNLPAEKRGQELTKEDIKRYAGQTTTYQISESVMPLDVLTGMEALHEKHPLRNMPGNPTMDDIILSSHQKFDEALEDDDPAIRRAAQWFKDADEETQRKIIGV